ncbi:MAG: hypothetical protein U1E76_11705 [Planctomycetota bacterium]
MMRLRLLVAAVAALAASCDHAQAPAPRKTTHFPPMPSKGEWFWKDHLLPDDLPPLAPSGQGNTYHDLLALAGRNPAQVEDSIARLAAAPAPAIPELAAALVHADRSVSYAAVCALGRMRDPLAARALVLGFRHSLPEIAVLAIQGAMAQAEPWLVPRLIVEFGWRDVNPILAARVAAAAALLDRQWMGGIPLLIKVLKENTPIADEANREWDRRERIAWEKELAIAALARAFGNDFGFNENAPAVMQVDLVRRVQAFYEQHCVELNQRTPAITDPRLVALIRRLIGGLNTFQLRNVDDARFVLETLGPRVAPFLLEGAFADAFYTRYHCLEVLGKFREEATLAERTQWSKRHRADRHRCRPSAARASGSDPGWLAAPETIPALARLLSDGELGVRTAAALALGRSGQSSARAALERVFRPAAATSEDQVAMLAAQIELKSEPALDAFLLGFTAARPEVSSTTLDMFALLTGKDLRPQRGEPWQPGAAIEQARQLLRKRYFAERLQGKPDGQG